MNRESGEIGKSAPDLPIWSTQTARALWARPITTRATRGSDGGRAGSDANVFLSSERRDILSAPLRFPQREPMTPEELNRTMEFIVNSQARLAAGQEQD